MSIAALVMADPNVSKAFKQLFALPVQITFATALDWGGYAFPVHQYTRQEAARVLRQVRRQGAYIEKRATGYYVEFPDGWKRMQGAA